MNISVRARRGADGSLPAAFSGPDAAYRKRNQAAQHDVAAKFRPFGQQFHSRKALEQRLEHDTAFESCERRPKTMVNAASKRQVRPRAASDIEPVGLLERFGVAIGRAGREDGIRPVAARNTDRQGTIGLLRSIDDASPPTMSSCA